VPGSALTPDYGLLTSTTDADGKTTSTQYGSSPWLALATAVIDDPSGLALSTQFAYEASGSGKYYRPITKTLPAGNQWTMTYYGANAVAIPSGCPNAGTMIQQGGALWTRTPPDPDCAGSQTAEIQVH